MNIDQKQAERVKLAETIRQYEDLRSEHARIEEALTAVQDVGAAMGLATRKLAIESVLTSVAPGIRGARRRLEYLDDEVRMPQARELEAQADRAFTAALEDLWNVHQVFRSVQEIEERWQNALGPRRGAFVGNRARFIADDLAEMLLKANVALFTYDEQGRRVLVRR